MASQEAHPNFQAVRRVYDSGHSANSSTSSTETIYLVCHPDPSSGKDILLWDDIKAAFDDFVIHVRSGAVVLPFLKGADFKNLHPLRIDIVPGVTLEVVVRGQLGARELLQEPLQKALTETSHEMINTSPVALVNSANNAAPARRNPVGGLVEEAMQNYNHIDNPAALPPRRGPQAIFDEQATPKDNDNDIPKLFTTITGSNSDNSDLEQRYAVALSDIGDLYHFGHNVSQDFSKAMKWYQKAAEQGDAAAQSNVGQLTKTVKVCLRIIYKSWSGTRRRPSKGMQ
ncbi:hypothetical protein BGZ96_011871 [Linnemannia gamsii]|uniref:HCP-like protein n=1 Tax=Linnemannia gamsii TaxID=64522 RepID=A0ABQ7JRI1_9FUNG|nr:hypothetical protein BGZ96_011871 [Linnemannia gamsii]